MPDVRRTVRMGMVLKMAELKRCPCIHACDIRYNAVGETIAYCELTAEWMNISLGDCSGNCDSEEVNNG